MASHQVCHVTQRVYTLAGTVFSFRSLSYSVTRAAPEISVTDLANSFFHTFRCNFCTVSIMFLSLSYLSDFLMPLYILLYFTVYLRLRISRLLANHLIITSTFSCRLPRRLHGSLACAATSSTQFLVVEGLVMKMMMKT